VDRRPVTPGGLNVHVYPTPFVHESRILKITKTLADGGVFRRIDVMAALEDGLPEVQDIDGRRRVLRVKKSLGRSSSSTFWKAMRTLEWSWRLKDSLLGRPVACVNCHSLAALPLCVFLKRRKGAALVYDTHELETETLHTKGLRRVIARTVERLLIRFADEVVVVNDAIADWYRRAYGLDNVTVVRNVPVRRERDAKKSRILRDAFGIGEDGLVFLYQGILTRGRGVNLLLDAFAGAGPDRHILFLGYGDLEGEVTRAARRFPNIHYHSAVPPEKIAEFTAGADVGVSLIENVCLSYYMSLPNKVFEYLQCGLPVVVSRFPAMAEIVDRFGCGWAIPVERDLLARLVTSITREEISRRSERALEAGSSCHWALEEPTLLGVYRRLGFGPGETGR
jgi:glycosyltransferase involved in cell wall biosynthesis